MKNILVKKSHRPDDVIELSITTDKEKEEIEILIFNLNRIVERMIEDFSDPETLRNTLAGHVPGSTDLGGGEVGNAYVSRLKEFQQWIYLLTVQLKEGRENLCKEPLLA